MYSSSIPVWTKHYSGNFKNIHDYDDNITETVQDRQIVAMED